MHRKLDTENSFQRHQKNSWNVLYSLLQGNRYLRFLRIDDASLPKSMKHPLTLIWANWKCALAQMIIDHTQRKKWARERERERASLLCEDEYHQTIGPNGMSPSVLTHFKNEKENSFVRFGFGYNVCVCLEWMMPVSVFHLVHRTHSVYAYLLSIDQINHVKNFRFQRHLWLILFVCFVFLVVVRLSTHILVCF